jgi:CDGSH iron-sulfur domain-containing protein 3
VSQPLCDGSHEDTGFSPLQFTASETKRVFFCTCKRTATPPLCDGSHKELSG